MQVIPAIDLREGACVQLVGGSYNDERIRIFDPVAVAEKWMAVGFRRMHLVDLDAATGRGSNRTIVEKILAVCSLNGQGEAEAKIQCGGGVREIDTIDNLLAAGASEVVVGTRAIEDRSWLERAAARYPKRIIVASDARDRQLVTRGWSETISRDVVDFVESLNDLPLAGILVTAVDGEGRMGGPDLALMRELAGVSQLPLQAAGGVRSIQDLHQLANLGVSAAIIGMALYTAALDAQTVIEEFAV
jgi:phosphoribosylformimino-5-aminoimidazole carboxamide ribotide isomerase